MTTLAWAVVQKVRLPGMPQLLALLGSVLLLLWVAGQGGEGWVWPDWQDPLLRHIRLPRMASALLVGAALAASAAALQAIFRNPMADPGLLGTSGGAALGVVLLLVTAGTGSMVALSLPLVAFGGGVLTTLFILLLHRWVGGGTGGLLLIGLMVGAACGAGISLLLFLSDDLALRGAMAWLSGNLSAARFSDYLPALACVVLGLLLLCWQARNLDVLLLGDDSAQLLGVEVSRVRALTIVGTALCIGAAVALAGIIGFIGILVPNGVAMFSGGSRRRLILLSAWGGALLLLVLDTLARTVAYPLDLPVGILVCFIGPPCFVLLLWRQQRRKEAA
ncbi:FecCD family ABC transporter permease [Leeia sp.]|uniref:FecCD family ABC transporter permease n=1 Tax=Leeia sp. TaxID=2884678 RepID=UPI0035B1AFD9